MNAIIENLFYEKSNGFIEQTLKLLENQQIYLNIMNLFIKPICSFKDQIHSL